MPSLILLMTSQTLLTIYASNETSKTFLICILLAVKVIPWVEFAVRWPGNYTQPLFQRFVQGLRWKWFHLIAFGNGSENAERVTNQKEEHQMCITLIRFWCWICEMQKGISLKTNLFFKIRITEYNLLRQMYISLNKHLCLLTLEINWD